MLSHKFTIIRNHKSITISSRKYTIINNHSQTIVLNNPCILVMISVLTRVWLEGL